MMKAGEKILRVHWLGSGDEYSPAPGFHIRPYTRTYYKNG